MKNKISGAIATIWGGLIVINYLFSTSHCVRNEAYHTGENVACIIGGLLFVAGIYTFFKKTKPKIPSETKE